MTLLWGNIKKRKGDLYLYQPKCVIMAFGNEGVV